MCVGARVLLYTCVLVCLRVCVLYVCDFSAVLVCMCVRVRACGVGV